MLEHGRNRKDYQTMMWFPICDIIKLSSERKDYQTMNVKMNDFEVEEEKDSIVVKLKNGEEVEIGNIGYIYVRGKDGKVKVYLEW